MKLQCQVEVVNRLHNSLNIKSSGKYLKSTLALGNEPNNKKEYFILHFSSVNKTGTKYNVKFVKQVFVKCLQEGKSTIRFKEPPLDLCIKGEAIQLKCFMRLLKQCITGDTKDLQLSSLANISVTAKENAPTKLTIRDRSDMPLKGLPRTLQSLHMSGLNLRNFRNDILMLKHLVTLDLSNNDIRKIPPAFGKMPHLSELYLANNKLGMSEDINWEWLLGLQITQSLRLVDLSGNQLTYLPKSIWKLDKLVTLKVDNNMLTRVPTTLGRIGTLRYLSLSKNNLDIFPCSLKHCHLQHLDISSNKFTHKCLQYNESKDISRPWKCYSLVKLASEAVLKHRLPYSPATLPQTLVEDLEDADICICGAPVMITDEDFNHSILAVELELSRGTIIYDHNPLGSSVVLDLNFCSARCLLPWTVGLHVRSFTL